MNISTKSYSGLEKLEVFSIRHWTKKTFSFQCKRPKNLRFRSGEFVMIGLENGDKPLLRAYSIVSPSWDETLEFYSIKVSDGPLTSRLQNLSRGDSVFLKPKSVGTLVLDALLPSQRLILFSTGTGIAPFLSVIRDPETYEKFDQVILTHTCRYKDELEYGKKVYEKTNNDNLLSEIISGKLKLISTTTRENTPLMGRMTEWLQNGKFKINTGADLNVETDRVMICGSLDMLQDHKNLCLEKGMIEGSNSNPGHFVIEKAFVD